jgi:hypothetical protein
MTTNEQLELGFNSNPIRLAGKRRESRVARATWWFAKMRETVAGAIDWQAEAEPRAEQIWFPGANRQLKV